MGEKCTSFNTFGLNKLAFVIYFISDHNIFIHWLPACAAAKCCCCGCCYVVNNAFSTACWWDAKVLWKIYWPAWDSCKLSEGFGSSQASVGWEKQPRLTRESLWGLITTYARLRVGLLPQRDAVRCVESLMNGYHAPCLLAKQRTWREPLPLSPQACHYWTPAVVHVFGTGLEDYINKGCSESMRRGEDCIRASAFWWLLSAQINCFIADMTGCFMLLPFFAISCQDFLYGQWRNQSSKSFWNEKASIKCFRMLMS